MTRDTCDGSSRADPTGPGSPELGLTAEQIGLVATVLVEFARDQSRQLPPPKGLPFFGVDHPAGELTPYETLAARGIFRKYETVLLLGAGLGGAARWCHAQFGCAVVGVDAAAAAAAAAAMLSQRARAAAHTRFLASSAASLALKDRRVTHVWAVEGWADVELRDRRLAEIFRAVRLGGLAALQQSGADRAWAARACEALASVGFAEPAAVVIERPPLRESIRRARERFLEALRRRPAPEAAATAEALDRLYRSWPAEGGAVAQAFGRRPS